MFVTRDMLIQHGACDEGVVFFDHFAPNGAELIDMIRQRHVPKDYLHWIVNHLTTTEEERQAYAEVLHITNSTNYFQCQNIDNCDMITESKDVKNSKYIYHCTSIEDSEDVAYSYQVKNSKTVLRSENTFNSQDIVGSNNIKASKNTSKSSFIINSSDIFSSSLITDSKVILQSKNIQSSMFLMDCRDCNHCLFCDGAVDAEYQIFNHKIDKTQWEFIYSELDEFITELGALVLFDKWDPEDPAHDAIIHNSYMIMFEKLLSNDRFMYWIKHLPYYSDMIAYKITFHPNFLQE